MTDEALQYALDRTLSWIRDRAAVRWDRARLPSKERIFGLLVSVAPVIVVGGDAVQEEWGRTLARMLMRIVGRTFPLTRARVIGDAALQIELDAIAEDMWPGLRRRDACTLEVVVGGVGAPPTTRPVFVGVDHWIAQVAHEPIRVSDGNGASCIVAASIAASELTKAALHRLVDEHGGFWSADDLEPLGAFGLNTYDPRGLVSSSVAPTGDLGEVLVVSAGALTQAVVAALLADGGVTARLRVLDHDLLDATNLNRYLLVGWRAAHERMPKVRFLESLANRKLMIRGNQHPYAEGTERVPVVLVGADRLSARHAVQRDGHRLVVNGASEVNFVRVSVHERGSGLACLKCINPGVDPPLSDPAPTIAFVSSLAGGLLAAQLYRTLLTGNYPGVVFDLNVLQPARDGNQSARQQQPVAGCDYCCPPLAATA